MDTIQQEVTQSAFHKSVVAFKQQPPPPLSLHRCYNDELAYFSTAVLKVFLL